MRSRNPCPWFGLALLSLALGCGGSEGGGGGEGGEVDPGFALLVIEPSNGVAVVAAGGEEPIILVVTAPEGERAPTVYLDVEGLPEGVTFQADAIPSGGGQGYLYLIAAEDAPRAERVETRIVASTLDGRKARATVRVTVDGTGVVEPACAEGLDSTFGTLNCRAAAVVGANPVMGDLLVLGDGSIVAVGHRGDGKGWVAKWTATGRPDIHFGQAGVQVVEEPFVPEKAAALADGSLILGGRYVGTAAGETGAPVLALFNGGGLHGLDPLFGFPVLAPGTGSVRALAVLDGVVHASIALDGGGHVLSRLDLGNERVYPPSFEGPAPDVAAFAADGSLVAGADGAVFRFDAEGRWDTTFGEAGRLPMTGAWFGGVLPVGTVGNFLACGNVGADGFLIRVRDGDWDYDFGGLVSRVGAYHLAVDLVGLPDGVAIAVYESGAESLAVIRYDAYGEVRPNYGDGGILSVGFKAQTPDARLAADGRGRILAMAVGAPDAVVLVRLPR